MADSPNPWGVTKQQARVLDAIVETGCHKLASRKLALSAKTIEVHSRKAKERMGHANRVLVLLAWDRWRRANPVEPK